jgi:hypothetical protein
LYRQEPRTKKGGCQSRNSDERLTWPPNGRRNSEKQSSGTEGANAKSGRVGGDPDATL